MTNEALFRQQRIVIRFAWPWKPVELDGRKRTFGLVRVQQITAVQIKQGQIVGTEWRDWKILS